jgi:hypothetical protein
VAIYEITASTTIDVAPEHVWAILDDVHGWRTWMPSTKNIHIDILTPGPPRQGYRFRLRGKVARALVEVTEFEQLERTTRFRLNVPPLDGTNRCLLIPLKDGRYTLKRIDQLVLPGPVITFLDSTQRAHFEKLAVEFLRTLKQAVNRRANNANTQTSI